MAFSSPSTARSSASSKVQLWQPAKEVLQFLTECVLPNPAITYPEFGSACALSDVDGKISIAAPEAVKRPPPARWEPPAQMKVNANPSEEEMGDGNLSSEMESSSQNVSSSRAMEKQAVSFQGSVLIDCVAPLQASSAAGRSIAEKSSFLGSLGSSIAERSSFVGSLGSSVAERSSVLGSLGSSIAERSSFVGSLGSSIAEKSSLVGSLGSPIVGHGVCEDAPTTSSQEYASSAAIESVGLMQNPSIVEKGESNISGSEKDHPEPLDLLMNAIQVATKTSSATQNPDDGEKQVEAEKKEYHLSPGVQRVAIFVHGHVPIAQKRVSRRAKSSYLKSQSVQIEEKKLLTSNGICDTSFHKEESPEDGWLFEKHAKQASLESIIYGDAGPPIPSKRGRSQTLPSRYQGTTVSTTYKRSRSKSFKCSSKIWTFA